MIIYSKLIGQLTCQPVLKISPIRMKMEGLNKQSLVMTLYSTFCQLQALPMPVPEPMVLDLNLLEVCSR